MSPIELPLPFTCKLLLTVKSFASFEKSEKLDEIANELVVAYELETEYEEVKE
jgi:hypothetical protein